MKALVLSASLTLTLGIAGLVGCSAEHVTAVEDTAALVSEGEPVPGDPFGVVEIADLMCHLPGEDIPTWTGWVEPRSCEGECELERFLVTCSHDCDSDSDCPVPLSGDSVPVCYASMCQLPCEDDSTCPNGFICVSGHTSDWFLPKLCMQSFGPDIDWPSPMPGTED